MKRNLRCSGVKKRKFGVRTGVTIESRRVGGETRLQSKGGLVAVLSWLSPQEDGAAEEGILSAGEKV